MQRILWRIYSLSINYSTDAPNSSQGAGSGQRQMEAEYNCYHHTCRLTRNFKLTAAKAVQDTFFLTVGVHVAREKVTIKKAN
jgi:hypothetical protein